MPAPLHFVILTVSGLVNRSQQDVIEYLQEENRVLREHLEGKRIRFTGQTVGGRYRIEAPVGTGRMGQVYRAHDLELDVPVALKTIRSEIADNPEALRRFKQDLLRAKPSAPQTEAGRGAGGCSGPSNLAELCDDDLSPWTRPHDTAPARQPCRNRSHRGRPAVLRS